MKKKLSLIVVLGMVCVSVMAQGALNFANVNAQVNAPVYLQFGSTLYPVGADYIAQLWYGAPGSAAAQLQPHPITSFFSSQPGYFLGGARIIDGFAGGSQIVVQVRAWNAAAGSSWGAALASPIGQLGCSESFNVTLATPPAVPSNLVGLQSFFIWVPEPSTFSLAGLGAIALMIFRRRN